MQAAILLAFLALGQAESDPLLAKLDAEFETLVAEERQAAKVREAASLLAGTNSSNRWTDYSKALAILRETRPKAGVPLLLAYMIRHSTLSTGHVSIPAYAETLTVLTGKEIPSPYESTADREAPVRRAVEKLVAEWWEPQREKISTELAEWDAGQVQALAARILKSAAGAMRGSSTDPAEWQARPTSYAVYHLLYYNILEPGSDPPAWRLEELHPNMAEAFLAPAGYRAEPEAPPARDTSRPAYASVALLAALRMNGELDGLDEIAEDANQTAGTRLTATMALFRAGEKLRTEVLMDVAANDRNLERRLVAILTLRYAEADRPAGRLLLELLDDENAEIRTAAICALKGPLPPQAIPKLKQAIDNLDPLQAMLFVFDVLGEYKNRDACEALAAFLAAGLEDKRKSEWLYRALSGLETATGRRWNQAGAQTDDFYRSRARIAIDWWKSEGRLTVE